MVSLRRRDAEREREREKKDRKTSIQKNIEYHRWHRSVLFLAHRWLFPALYRCFYSNRVGLFSRSLLMHQEKKTRIYSIDIHTRWLDHSHQEQVLQFQLKEEKSIRNTFLLQGHQRSFSFRTDLTNNIRQEKQTADDCQQTILFW